MPVNAVHGKEEEGLWARAKAAAEKQGQGHNWALVMHIFQKMKGSKGVKNDQIPGGLAAGKSDSKFDSEQLAAGTLVEMEHTKDRKIAREIAKDHLTEDADYYKKLKKIEKGSASDVYRYWHDRVIIKATQMGLFGGNVGGATGAEKPPAGFTPIPGSKHGGYHKKVGDHYQYWYPGRGISAMPHEKDYPAMAHHFAHLASLEEKEPEKPAPVAPAPKIVVSPEEIKHEREKEPAPSGGGGPGLLEAAAGGQRPDRPVNEGPSEEERREAAPRDIGEDLDLNEFFDVPPNPCPVVDPRPVTDQKGPAIAEHADLLPRISSEMELPDSLVNFPHPAPIIDRETGKQVGAIDKLYPHQKEGAERINWAWKHRDGVLIQDSAGLGKSLTALAALQAHGGKRNLVVVPVSGKENLKTQWMGPENSGVYGIDMQGVDKLSSTAPGYYIVSYDELLVPDLDENGKQKVNIEGEALTKFRPELFDGTWDTIAFDECHNMKKMGSRSVAARQLMTRADKVLYMSATPFENVKEMHYLWKTGLFNEGPEGQVLLGNDDSTDKFLKWAEYVGCEVKGKALDSVNNPTSPLPMAAVAAVMHVDGISINRVTSMEGLHARFDLMKEADIPEEHLGAVSLARQIIKDAEEYAVLPGGCLKALFTGWSKKYWEGVKTDKAIEYAKKALAEGKQVALYSEFKVPDHAHLAAIPKYLRRKAERLPDDQEGKAMQLLAQANHFEAMIARLPKMESTPKKLVDALGGPGKVAEIHGDTRKKATSEQAMYQSGEKKVCVATISKGATGISLHDTKGTAPRVQINLTIPYTSMGWLQLAGRSHRLGSKSETEMIWMIADTETEHSLAHKCGKRLGALGALTSGNPEKASEATSLMASDFAADIDPDASVDDMVDGLEAMVEEERTGKPHTQQLRDEAEAARAHFRQFAEARKGGRDVLKERYTDRQIQRQKEAMREGRRAAEQLKQHFVSGPDYGPQITYRPTLGMYEIDARGTGLQSKIKKMVTGAKVGGKQLAYLDTFLVPIENMPALAKVAKAHEIKVDLAKLPKEKGVEDLTKHEKTVEELLFKHALRVIPHPMYHGTNLVSVTGNTKELQSAIKKHTTQRYDRSYGWAVPADKLDEMTHDLNTKNYEKYSPEPRRSSWPEARTEEASGSTSKEYPGIDSKLAESFMSLHPTMRPTFKQVRFALSLIRQAPSSYTGPRDISGMRKYQVSGVIDSLFRKSFRMVIGPGTFLLLKGNKLPDYHKASVGYHKKMLEIHEKAPEKANDIAAHAHRIAMGAHHAALSGQLSPSEAKMYSDAARAMSENLQNKKPEKKQPKPEPKAEEKRV